MKKVIYAYFNQCDIDPISDLLKSNKIIFCNKNKEEIEILPAIDGFSTIYLYFDGVEFGVYQPCWGELSMQCGMFVFEYDKNSPLKTVFNSLKKHIVKEFKLSQDKSCYIGRGIYEDWWNYKYLFPFPFAFESFCVSKEKLNLIFDGLTQNGYQIRNNNVKISHMDDTDTLSDSIVIFDKETELKPRIVKRKYIRYDYGQECIFVIKRKKCYEFILDKRIDCKSYEKTANLFYKLKQEYITVE